jgi:hypothetical protein
MTTPRTIQTQHKFSRRTYQPTGDGHVELFAGLAAMLHAGGIAQRLNGLIRVIKAGRKLK